MKWLGKKALCALKDSITKIISDIYKLGEESEMNQGFLVKRKLNEFNVLLETWKYDFIKNMKTRYDKSNLEPLKYELDKHHAHVNVSSYNWSIW